MSRFNLTFRGEIIEGYEPAQVKTRLATALAIDDPDLLQRYFSGDPVVLRHNLERKEAAELYARLRRLGILAELVKVIEKADPSADHNTDTAPAAAALALALATARPTPKPPAAPDASTRGTTEQESEARAPQNISIPRPGSAPAAELKSEPDQSAQNSGEDLKRRADLAANHTLQMNEAALLHAKEKALENALMAKHREKAAREQTESEAQQLNLLEESGSAAKSEKNPKPKPKPKLKSKSNSGAAPAKGTGPARARRKAESAKNLHKDAVAAGEEHRHRIDVATQPEREAHGAEAAAQAGREHPESKEREPLAAQPAAKAESKQLRAEKEQGEGAAKAASQQQKMNKAIQVAGRLREELARRKNERSDEATKRKAQEAHKKAQEQAEQEQQENRRKAMEEQAIQRGADELAHKPGLKPVEARVRTRLETPSRQRISTQDGTQDRRRRKRQPGEPNFYSLRPFRNTPDIRARAGQSRRIMQLAFGTAAAALAAAVLLGAGMLSQAPATAVSGAQAIAVDPKQQPLLLAGDHLLLHDRAGVSVSDLTLDRLGLTTLSAPMAFNAAGELLAVGRAAGEDEESRLMRCVLAESRCEEFSAQLAGTVVSALAVHPLDGNLFIADSSAGQLLKVSPTGTVLASATIDLPAHPALRLDSGLLFVSSMTGPALGVFRYEDEAWAQQLDEILLMPPTEQANEITGVRDFIRGEENWWVLLDKADSSGARLYRFSSQWRFIDKLKLIPDRHPTQLVTWGKRILVTDPTHIPIQRLNSAGTTEAPLVSAPLAELFASQERRTNLMLLGWRVGLALCLLVAFASLGLGWLHRSRRLVYTSCREQGAEPIDALAGHVDWVEVDANRSASLRQRGKAYAALVAAAVVIAIGLGISSLKLAALLLALTGPVIALLLLYRSEPGHIGVAGEQLLLVDHDGMYHMGSGSRIHYRGPFLMIDDVTVFTGSRLLPAFSRGWIEQRAKPLAIAGIKVDSTIVTVKLLQARHPLALGAVAIAATSSAAIALLSLQGIF